MSWIDTVTTIRTEVSNRNLSTSQLEALTREVPLRVANDEAVTAVGSAVESELRDRYVTELADTQTESILAECETSPDQYTNRVQRARSDALQRVLEVRFPSEPDAPDPIDTYDEKAKLTFGQHLANWYREIDG